MLSQKTTNWLNKVKKQHKLIVKIVNLDQLKKWKISKSEIYHESKKFFKIIGLKINSNFYKENWNQPIIVQNEVGILGIIKNLKTKKYLLQAKVEPGNINKMQLAPTVQATKSNYRQVHGGSKVPYIEHFLKLKKIERYNQPEQGFRYLNKFNSNILLELKNNIKIKENFHWFSKNEIRMLVSKKKNMINMDTISIFSSFIKKIKFNYSINTNKKIYSWLSQLDKNFYLKTKIIDLKKINKWSVNNKKISHKSKKHFSIIGINITANKREVQNWSQPILKGKDLAFAGFLKAKFNNTNHYLCRYILKPGLKKSTIGCTINTSDINNYQECLNDTGKYFVKNFFLSQQFKKNIIFDNILSDEGGRFYKCQIRYMIIAIKNPEIIDIPKNYLWLSYNQMIEMIYNKKLDIESRLLFGCDNISKIK
jgi:oxidase EvaA